MTENQERNQRVRRRKVLALLGTASVTLLGANKSKATLRTGNSPSPTIGEPNDNPGDTSTEVANEDSPAESIEEYGGIEGDDSANAIEANVNAIHDASEASVDNRVYLPAGEWYIGVSGGATGSIFHAGSDGKQRGSAGLGFIGEGPNRSFLKVGHIIDGSRNAIRYADDTFHTCATWKDLTYDGNFQNNRGGIQVAIEILGDGEFTFENVRFRNHHTGGISFESDTETVAHFDRCTFYNIGLGRLNQTGDRHSQPLSVSGKCDLTVTNSEFRLTSSNPIDYGIGASGVVTVRNCYAEGLGVGFIKINDLTSLTAEKINCVAQTQELLKAQEVDNSIEFRGRFFLRRISGNPGVMPEVTLNDIYASDITRSAILVANGHDLRINGAPDRPIVFERIAQDPGDPNDNSAGVIVESGSEIQFNIDKLSVHDVDGTVFDLENSFGTIDTLSRDNTAGLGDTASLTVTNDQPGTPPFEPDVPTRDEVGIILKRPP